MSSLPAINSFLSSFDALLKATRVPEGPERRCGAIAQAAGTWQAIHDEAHAVRALDEAHGDGAAGMSAMCELAVAAASLLYATGAACSSWQPWEALAGQGLRLDARPREALPHAILGGSSGNSLPLDPNAIRLAVPDVVLWSLVSHTSAGPSPHGHWNPGHAAWWTLAKSIPARNHAQTGKALQALADYWMGEDPGWEQFHPGQCCIAVEACAAATLACRLGYRPQGLSAGAMRFLHAGLACSLSQEAT